MNYFNSSIYFFNCLESLPRIIFNSLSNSTIPLAPSFWIASLLAREVSFKVTTNLDIADLVDTIDFLNIFDCTVVPASTINEEILTSILESFSKIKSRDFKGLNRYYNMAKENTNVYKKIVNVNKFLYNQPYRLIQSVKQREKHLVRVRENEG